MEQIEIGNVAGNAGRRKMTPRESQEKDLELAGEGTGTGNGNEEGTETGQEEQKSMGYFRLFQIYLNPLLVSVAVLAGFVPQVYYLISAVDEVEYQHRTHLNPSKFRNQEAILLNGLSCYFRRDNPTLLQSNRTDEVIPDFFAMRACETSGTTKTYSVYFKQNDKTCSEFCESGGSTCVSMKNEDYRYTKAPYANNNTVGMQGVSQGVKSVVTKDAIKDALMGDTESLQEGAIDWISRSKERVFIEFEAFLPDEEKLCSTDELQGFGSALEQRDIWRGDVTCDTRVRDLISARSDHASFSNEVLCECKDDFVLPSKYNKTGLELEKYTDPNWHTLQILKGNPDACKNGKILSGVHISKAAPQIGQAATYLFISAGMVCFFLVLHDWQVIYSGGKTRFYPEHGCCAPSCCGSSLKNKNGEEFGQVPGLLCYWSNCCSTIWLGVVLICTAIFAIYSINGYNVRQDYELLKEFSSPALSNATYSLPMDCYCSYSFPQTVAMNAVITTVVIIAAIGSFFVSFREEMTTPFLYSQTSHRVPYRILKVFAGDDEHPTEVDLVSNDYGNKDYLIPAIADMKTYKTRCKELELNDLGRVSSNVNTMVSQSDSKEIFKQGVKVQAEAKKTRDDEKCCNCRVCCHNPCMRMYEPSIFHTTTPFGLYISVFWCLTMFISFEGQNWWRKPMLLIGVFFYGVKFAFATVPDTVRAGCYGKEWEMAEEASGWEKGSVSMCNSKHRVLVYRWTLWACSAVGLGLVWLLWTYILILTIELDFGDFEGGLVGFLTLFFQMTA